MYDYFLGGKDHFAADRDTADKALAAWPGVRTSARENRAFLGRAVRYLAGEAGVTQFLDIGSGLPGVGNVHEVAQAVNPAARVVYVDNDPIVLAHGRALLASTPEGRSEYINADMRDPEKILSHPVTRDTLDFTKPVALMLVSVLHFFPDDDQVRRITGPLVGALPPGSYVTASHGTAEFSPEAREAGQAYTRDGVDAIGRDADVFADLVFDGLTLVSPGVVLVSEWRPEPGTLLPSPAEVSMYGAVASKPLRRAPPVIRDATCRCPARRSARPWHALLARPVNDTSDQPAGNSLHVRLYGKAVTARAARARDSARPRG